ncbi:sperm protein CH-like domain-containing protein [Trichomonas vaginalis G3]|nr:sperm protein CH-like domain-containing protein [Trichomonas vaginalis G3]KAI5535406.1 sperm protein CH-like domain-containing protein [Trichomonas vaginalis G3]
MRQDNWNQLAAVFQKNKIPIQQYLIDEVIKRKQGSAVTLIEILYTHFTKLTPSHPNLGNFSSNDSKEKGKQAQVTTIAPPTIPKTPEPQPEIPPPAPNRQRFIGSTSVQRTGAASDLTPISFESASVIKSGPGFLELRNSNTPATEDSDPKVLDNAIDELTKEITPESLQTFITSLSDPIQLAQFLEHYPPDLIVHFLTVAAPKTPPEYGSCLIDYLIDLFIPTLTPEALPIGDLADFIFSVPSQDPFTHHILLYHVLEHAPEDSRATILSAFLTRETELSKPLAEFYAQKIEGYSKNDPQCLLPQALTKLINFDRQAGIPLIPLFPPTGDQDKDVQLVGLYTKATEEALPQIKEIITGANRSVAALVLSTIAKDKSLTTEQMASLLLLLPDPMELLSTPYSIESFGQTYNVDPLIQSISTVDIAESMANQINQSQPDRIDKEIFLLSALMTDIRQDDAERWTKVFNNLHEYLYLAFCDENVCKEVSNVCLAFYKMIQGEVFSTFSVLFKALNYVFPSNCPAICKQVSAEFLSKAAEINPNFSQAILKLLMNFPPKTNPDLDRLIAALKKVRK